LSGKNKRWILLIILVIVTVGIWFPTLRRIYFRGEKLPSRGAEIATPVAGTAASPTPTSTVYPGEEKMMVTEEVVPEQEQWGRDPFLPPRQLVTLPPKEEVPKEEIAAEVEKPSFNLMGIFCKGTRKIAVINEEVLEEGQMIGNYQVSVIQQDRVILIRNNERVILKFENEGE
jgi:hypothetical protein